MAAVATEPKVRTKKKLFHKINEVSKLTGLKPYVLRYWETEFPQISPEKDPNDQRRYRQTDIDTILKIKNLLYNEKFTIAGAKLHLEKESAATAKTVAPTARQTKAPSPRKTPATRRPAAKPKHPSAPKIRSVPRTSTRNQSVLEQLSGIRSDLNELLACLG